MASRNTASADYNSSTQLWEVSVKSIDEKDNAVIYSHSDMMRVKAIAARLDRIFSDPLRDLDFITPSYANGHYVVCCPLVRRDGSKTIYHVNYKSSLENLYELTNWQDSTVPSEQSAIMTVVSSDNTKTPWLMAFEIANRIRKIVQHNIGVPSLFDNKTIKDIITQLGVVTADIANMNRGSIVVNKQIFNKAEVAVQFYGLRGQGDTSNISNPSREPRFMVNPALVSTSNQQKKVQTISSPFNYANNEVFHAMDLTAAIGQGLINTYKNKFMKVTNLENSLSVVVRVIDEAPTEKYFELSRAAWAAIGFPGGTDPSNDYKPFYEGRNRVKVELLSNS